MDPCEQFREKLVLSLQTESEKLRAGLRRLFWFAFSRQIVPYHSLKEVTRPGVTAAEMSEKLVSSLDRLEKPELAEAVLLEGMREEFVGLARLAADIERMDSQLVLAEYRELNLTDLARVLDDVKRNCVKLQSEDEGGAVDFFKHKIVQVVIKKIEGGGGSGLKPVTEVKMMKENEHYLEVNQAIEQTAHSERLNLDDLSSLKGGVSLVSGIAGSGKSTLCGKVMARHLELGDRSPFDRVFLLVCRQLNEMCEFVTFQCLLEQCGFSCERAVLSARDQKLFIVDGLDEWQDRNRFLTSSPPGSSSITREPTAQKSATEWLLELVSRSNDERDDNEMTRAVSVLILTRPAEVIRNPPKFKPRKYEILGLSTQTIDSLITKNLGENELALAKASRRLYLALCVPALCLFYILVRSMWRDGDDDCSISTSTQLYKHMVANILEKHSPFPGIFKSAFSVFRLYIAGSTYDSDEDDDEGEETVEVVGYLSEICRYCYELTSVKDNHGSRSKPRAPKYNEKVATSGLFTSYLIQKKFEKAKSVLSPLHFTLVEFMAALHVYRDYFNEGELYRDLDTYGQVFVFFFGLFAEPDMEPTPEIHDRVSEFCVNALTQQNNNIWLQLLMEVPEDSRMLECRQLRSTVHKHLAPLFRDSVNWPSFPPWSPSRQSGVTYRELRVDLALSPLTLLEVSSLLELLSNPGLSPSPPPSECNAVSLTNVTYPSVLRDLIAIPKANLTVLTVAHCSLDHQFQQLLPQLCHLKCLRFKQSGPLRMDALPASIQALHVSRLPLGNSLHLNHLKGMRYLYISKMEIGQRMSEIRFGKLKRLILRDVGVTFPARCPLPRLTFLDVSMNNLSGCLNNFVLSLPRTLKTLICEHCNFALHAYHRGLSTLPELKSINLSFTDFTPHTLMCTLRSLPPVEFLFLDSCTCSSAEYLSNPEYLSLVFIAQISTMYIDEKLTLSLSMVKNHDFIEFLVTSYSARLRKLVLVDVSEDMSLDVFRHLTSYSLANEVLTELDLRVNPWLHNRISDLVLPRTAHTIYLPARVKGSKDWLSRLEHTNPGIEIYYDQCKDLFSF